MALSPYFPGHGDPRYRRRPHTTSTFATRLSTNWLSGTATLSARTVEPLVDLELDLGPFRVNSAKVDGVGVRHTHRAGQAQGAARQAQARRRAALDRDRLRRTAAPGRQPVRRRGLEELTDGAMVASQPTGAPSWFPCNDRPDDKATYSLTVSTASAYQVLTNGAPVARRRAAGATTWVFAPTEPMATYLASVQIGRYQTSEGLACPARLGR
ncbi:hypothetical protein GCM10020219_052730 [Nonomuraea dietziae]